MQQHTENRSLTWLQPGQIIRVAFYEWLFPNRDMSVFDIATSQTVWSQSLCLVLSVYEASSQYTLPAASERASRLAHGTVDTMVYVSSGVVGWMRVFPTKVVIIC